MFLRVLASLLSHTHLKPLKEEKKYNGKCKLRDTLGELMEDLPKMVGGNNEEMLGKKLVRRKGKGVFITLWLFAKQKKSRKELLIKQDAVW